MSHIRTIFVGDKSQLKRLMDTKWCCVSNDGMFRDWLDENNIMCDGYHIERNIEGRNHRQTRHTKEQARQFLKDTDCIILKVGNKFEWIERTWNKTEKWQSKLNKLFDSTSDDSLFYNVDVHR